MCFPSDSYSAVSTLTFSFVRISPVKGYHDCFEYIFEMSKVSHSIIMILDLCVAWCGVRKFFKVLHSNIALKHSMDRQRALTDNVVHNVRLFSFISVLWVKPLEVLRDLINQSKGLWPWRAENWFVQSMAWNLFWNILCIQQNEPLSRETFLININFSCIYFIQRSG